MLPTDLLTLRERLADLAEVFERRPVTEKALRVWFDTLHDFPIERVAGVLIGWPKTHGKFPTPAELWKICTEIGSAEIERKAAALNVLPIHWERTPHGERLMARMKAIVNKPRLTPTQHWELALSRYRPGAIGYEYAKLALGNREERVPGEDDEAQR